MLGQSAPIKKHWNSQKVEKQRKSTTKVYNVTKKVKVKSPAEIADIGFIPSLNVFK